MGLTERDRVQTELKEVQAASDRGFSAEAAYEDLSEWTAQITGPPDTPYAGGKFKVDVKFPSGYPERSVMLQFITKIYHPNISPDVVQLSVLEDGWRQSYTPLKVLEALVQLLKEPTLEDAVASEIAEQYKTNREAFDKEAKEWTSNFAQG